MKKIFVLLILFLIIPLVSAKSGHMTLLAVQDVEKNIGSTADLYLEIKPGTGRIFLDTFPLTQIDTQMSTRLAREIACEFLERDCSKYDFFYTIRSGSSIVGGPSAGAALSALTVILLDNLKYDESIVVTGSINSGGIIGPVGGIETKIDVAEQNKISKILIPSIKLNETNITKNRTLEIVSVATLRDVIREFTGKDYYVEKYELNKDDEYNQIMKNIALTMCNRTNRLKEQVLIYYPDTDVIKKVENKTLSAEKAFNQSRYYPSASYCFGINIDLGNELSKNLSENKIIDEAKIISSAIDKFEKSLNEREIKTISDLQTKIIVKERLMDAKDYIKKSLEEKNLENARYNIAYSKERFNSAVIWSEFFNMSGKNIDLKKENLKISCINRIAEAEERFNYIRMISNIEFNSTKEDINQAKVYLIEEEYEMCLFKASNAKANIGVSLSVIGLTEETELNDLIDLKLKYAEEQIAKEVSKGSFPIMGYSYYLYSIDLKDSDPISSLIYSELALELSNMWPYFNLETKDRIEWIRFNQDFLNGFLTATIILICLILIFRFRIRKTP